MGVTTCYTWAMKPADGPMTHEAIPVAPELSRPRPALVIVYAPDHDRIGQQVIIDSAFRMGRLTSAFGGVPFDDPKMSRAHAVFSADAEGVVVEDGGSTNGTLVNGVPVGKVALSSGDLIQVGSVFLAFEQRLPGRSSRFKPDLPWGISTGIEELRVALNLVTPQASAVLISGEGGIGKRDLAYQLHEASRPSKPFVSVVCSIGTQLDAEHAIFGGQVTSAPLAERLGGALQQATSGSLMLVDIEALSPAAQLQLHWLLEASASGRASHRFDGAPPRLIATTCLSTSELQARVDIGAFRADLFGILRPWILEIPPLRERKQDIPIVVAQFIALYAGADGLDLRVEPELMWRLVQGSWQRNLSDLGSIIETACVEAVNEAGVIHETERLSRMLTEVAGSRPPSGQGGSPGQAAPRTREELLAVLYQHNFVVSRVASHFGKHRQQVYRWMERFGIDTPPKARRS